MVEKWIIILGMIVMSFIAGEIHGCSRAGESYKEAETRFLTKTIEIIKVEKKEVPIFKTKIQTIDKIVEKLVKESHEDISNISSCDLSDSRVHRINTATSLNTQ